MTPKEEYEKSMNDLIESPEIPNGTKQLSALIYSLGCISDNLGEINKNLEKIANNTEKDTGVSIPTINAIGNFFKEETRKLKELDSDTILCKQNKESYVDKNIILD